MTGLSIGFLSNQLDNRGTGNALYNYAHYNEEILGNNSYIFTFPEGNHDAGAVKKFQDRFETVWLPGWDYSMVDAVYHIKSGYDDGIRFNTIPYLVHSVFDNEPHGSVYATISPWMGERFSLPYVPHIVELPEHDGNLRLELGIPEDAVVFGRYGGLDSFDISWVWRTIHHYTTSNPNVYFIFMNTEPYEGTHSAEQILYLPGTVNGEYKRAFVNTCDAMIHARGRGETFGIAVGEFAIAGKPIITYENSHEKAHLQELGNFALTYHDPKSLVAQFDKVKAGPLVSWGYGQYTPEKVMKKFDEVFLSAVS